MELRHLRVAIALAEELHFGRTGARLRIAQSAVSTLVKELEAELGAALFARTRRSVRVTAEGAAFVDGARRVVSELAQAAASVHAAASGDAGRVVIRFVAMASLAGVPALIERFRRAHPAVALTAEPAPSSEQLAALREGRCDVAFVPIAATKHRLDDLAHQVIARSPLVALLPRRHPLAERRWIRLAELATERFAFLGELGEPRLARAFRQRCAEAGFDPDLVLEVDHTDVLLAFVAAGYAIAVAPALVTALGTPGVVAVPLRPAHHGGIAAVWKPAAISPAGRAFVASLASSPSGGDRRDRRASGASSRPRRP